MDAAAGLLPEPQQVDRALKPGYNAVATLVASCRGLPGGELPNAGARASWLRTLQGKAASARSELEKAR